MDLRRVRVDLQRGLKLAGGVGLVVLLQEQHPRLVVRRPVVRLLLQGVGVQLVHQKMELIGLPVPPRRLGGGQADPTQRFGRRHVVVVVVTHQPGVAAVRLVQLAGQAVQFGEDPAGQQLIAVDLEWPVRPAFGLHRRDPCSKAIGPVRPSTSALCRCQRLRLARDRLRLRKSGQNLHRLVVLPLGGQAAGQPDGRGGVLAGGGRVEIGGLGVLSPQPEFAGGGQRALSRPRRQTRRPTPATGRRMFGALATGETTGAKGRRTWLGDRQSTLPELAVPINPPPFDNIGRICIRFPRRAWRRIRRIAGG